MSSAAQAKSAIRREGDSMHIALLAPVNPQGLAEHLFPHELDRIHGDGDYGAAPTAIAVALLEAGATVSVISHRRGHPELRLKGARLSFVQVESRPRPRDQALDWWRVERRAMIAEIKAASPDLVHAHWTYEWALAALAVDLPTVITVRDAPLTILRYQFDSYRIIRTVMAYAVRIRGRGSLFIAASPYMAGSWRKQMLWWRPIPIIPNIVPRDVVSDEDKADHPVIVEVADAGRRKNVKGLLRAFDIVRRRVPHAELRLIGHGLAADSDLARWAEAKGLATGVTFLGRLDRGDMATHLSHAWIHAHGALEESFGNTLLEAMALGTPIVAGARSAAVPWVLRGGEAGYLCDVSKPQEFANAMIGLIADGKLRATLASAGKRQLSQEFSPSASAQAHMRVYRGMINASRPTIREAVEG